MALKGIKFTEEHKLKIGLANSISHLGLKQSKEHIAKRVKKMIGRPSPLKGKIWQWKDHQIEYGGIHARIEKQLGIPKYCEHCKRTDKNKYEWANKDHKYSLAIQDWMRLCTSCHRKYDYENHLANIGSGGGSIKNKSFLK